MQGVQSYCSSYLNLLFCGILDAVVVFPAKSLSFITCVSHVHILQRYTHFSTSLRCRLIRSIDLIHKWRSIYNSFVEVQISLPSLNTIQWIEKNSCSKMRLGRLICTWTKELNMWPPFMNKVNLITVLKLGFDGFACIYQIVQNFGFEQFCVVLRFFIPPSPPPN